MQTHPAPPAARATLFFALGLLALSAGACPRPRMPEGPTPTAAQLLAKSAQGSASVESVVGEAKVDYFDQKAGAKGRIKGKSLFIVSKPSSLRFDVLTPFDNPIAILASNGQSFGLINFQESAFLTGSPTPQNLGLLFQLSFRDQDVIQALLGQAPLLESAESEQVGFNTKAGAWEVTLKKGDDTQVLQFDPKSGHLLRAELSQAKKLVARISYSKYEPVEDQPKIVLPREILFEKPLEKADLLIKVVGDLDINTSPDPSVFQLSAPDGFTIFPLE